MAPLSGENIVCFAKDWGEDPTSNHHVMLELSRHNRVLWLNSIATRTPSLKSGRDLRKIKNKLRDFARGPVQVSESMWVYTPLVLPFPHVPAARLANRALLRATLYALRKRLGMDRFQLWTFLPNVADYLGGLGESLSVYYCVDEWSQFSYLDEGKTVLAEQRLCRQADVVFAVCSALADKKRALNPETHLATHGVDHHLFTTALLAETEVPADVADLRHPVLGFYGTLQDWVDQALLCQLADRHPEWNIVLLGQQLVDVSALRKRPNVHLLGRKRHAELPAYCKAFDVGLIPYVVSERMQYVNPIKLREYLSAGLPVVSTAVPEVGRYAEHCTVAESYDDFEAAVVRALASDSPERRRARSEAMRSETWEHKVACVGEHVSRVQRDRQARPSTGRR
jgi:glycosyltransferase involved in cell wall biosynthesis